MKKNALEHLAYPVGRFTPQGDYSDEKRAEWVQTLAIFPAQLATEVATLDAEGLNQQYRPGGWNIRQVVHHCADSHLNAYIRFKLALTEDNPTVKPYDEAAWAALPDTDSTPVYASLELLRYLHQRWVVLLNNMSEADFHRTYYHPEHEASFTLWGALDTYQWHCRHHLAHVLLAIANTKA
ncbi:MAG: putative metal-dependent hydrolase [Saprospiraceae bacterium]